MMFGVPVKEISTDRKRSIVTLALCAIFFMLISYGLSGIHDFGDGSDGRSSHAYLTQGANLTGSTNIVNSIVWDFRGFDTLGEETVFFTAVIAIALGARDIRKKKGQKYKKMI